MHPEITIWEGSASFDPDLTSFGYFNADSEFIIDSEKVAVWCGRRLGFPVNDVELSNEHFFSAFEEAIITYSSHINNYEARDNLIGMMGHSTGSVDLSEQYIPPTLNGVFKLARQYGTEVGAGGNLNYYTGSVNLVAGQQSYDLNENTVNLEVGDFQTDNFTIRRIFYEDSSALSRFLDPIGFSGLANQELLSQFGWAGYGVQYTLMPLSYDLMRMQGLEMHSQIRKSGYSFQLTGKRLRIFPIPKSANKLFFQYTLDDEESDAEISGQSGRITNISNMPYGLKRYKFINSAGRDWIRKYTLALCKEVLGLIRSKYSDIPMTGDNSVTLNGSDLINQAENEMNRLTEELLELLESFSRQSQLERKSLEAQYLHDQLKFVPTKIYVK